MTCNNIWTVQFDFPNGPVFPTNSNTYQYMMDKNVKTWTDDEKAAAFAREKCGKYGWKLVPIDNP